MAANKTAYTYYINPNGNGNTSGSSAAAASASTSKAENNSVHQTSPAWVLTFLRWAVRDTLRTKTANNLAIVSGSNGQPLVVENDCIQLGIADAKSVLTPSMSATLLITDVNYETEISPGDFVFCNILNWESDARRVANQARALQPINGIHDGFKGFFKVSSVRKSLTVDPQSGIKTYAVKITGYAFTEFNNSIYFNPGLINNTTDTNLSLYLTNIGQDWAQLQSPDSKGLNSIQDLVQFLINSFVGVGFPDNRKTNTTTPLTPNVHFYMPNGVDSLLGLPQVEAAKDTFNYLFGIQQYSATAQTLAQGMNPSNIQTQPGPVNSPEYYNRFILLQNPVEGTSYIKPDYWNDVKTWSILNQFVNSPLNELYTCFRVDPTGKVLPTMVFRQIPFTNDNFVANGNAGNLNVTRFMSVPRWCISPVLALSFDLGRDEALRLNFMQYFGIPVNSPQQLGLSVENAKQNFVYDLDDVKRNGLRPSVITSEFDFLSKDQAATYRASGWAKIVGDALIGGHLKMSGTITFIGIVEPIAVGDNLQFDGVVYHIEQISHNTSINPQSGKKIFRTVIVVSSGLDISSGTDANKDVMYGEMLYGGAYDKRTADYGQSQILPGVSESQDTYYRPTNPDEPISGGQSFVQPNTNTSIDKSTRDS